MKIFFLLLSLLVTTSCGSQESSSACAPVTNNTPASANEGAKGDLDVGAKIYCYDQKRPDFTWELEMTKDGARAKNCFDPAQPCNQDYMYFSHERINALAKPYGIFSGINSSGAWIQISVQGDDLWKTTAEHKSLMVTMASIGKETRVTCSVPVR